MLEQTATAIPSSLWSTITSWLTPIILFLLLNITIAAIALISSLASSSPPDPHHDSHSLIRSPSILHRLKSIRYETLTLKKNPQSDEFPQESPIPDPIPDEIPQEDDNDQAGGESMDEIYNRLKGFTRSKSETEPAVRVKKSASFHSKSVVDFETVVGVESRRPATVRERVRGRMTDGDAEVDAKADDFIYKFKQQLKLQKLDSIKERVWGKVRG